MSPNPKLRLLRLVADHYLGQGYGYQHVRAIIWVRNDDLMCDPADVDHVCRAAITEALRSGRWETARALQAARERTQ